MLYNVHVYTRGINVGVLIYVACIIYLDDSQREESVQGSSLAVTLFITKTGLYNFDPLKPHFYMVKLGFKGVNIIFLILLKKQIVGTSTHNRNMKNIRFLFYLKFSFFFKL